MKIRFFTKSTKANLLYNTSNIYPYQRKVLCGDLGQFVCQCFIKAGYIFNFNIKPELPQIVITL